MNFLIKIIKDFPSYLWSGWGAIASILLFLAFWDLGNQIYGNLILPSPKETFLTLFEMLKDEKMINQTVVLEELSRSLFFFSRLLSSNFTKSTTSERQLSI